MRRVAFHEQAADVTAPSAANLSTAVAVDRATPWAREGIFGGKRAGRGNGSDHLDPFACTDTKLGRALRGGYDSGQMTL